MKIRNGFVSNSSTTSFCIYGISSDSIDEDVDDMEEKIEEAGLEIHSGEEGTKYIGRSWRNIKDNETGLDFKHNIEKTIFDLFGKEKCYTIEEAWYNG